jgi:hypothetical protein
MEGTSLIIFDFHNGTTIASNGEEYTIQNSTMTYACGMFI